jgi:hypothetical protein
MPLCEGLTGASERAYLEIDIASHNVINGDNALTSGFAVARLKRSLNGDISYHAFLCPPPTAGKSGISQYRSSCPH